MTDRKHTDDGDDVSIPNHPLTLPYLLAAGTLRAAAEFWHGPQKDRPDWGTPITDGGEIIDDGDAGADQTSNVDAGSPDWVVEADDLPTREDGGHKVLDETPPTEAERIRAGLEPEDHGLRIRECGSSDAWISTTDHVRRKR